MAVAYEIGQLETVHALPTAGEMHEVVFGDPSMARLLALAESVASTPSTVLIHGESGAGKEVVARHIHTHSERASGPFVAINCAALPPSLLESELFGHERGAFSGAVRKHLGVFERAKGGTLLLDEVSEISPEMQAKLLRVLQERVLYRVGGTDPVNLDIRIVATTNRNLKEAIDEGSFRLDLYYRLNVFPLRIDAL
ncbi:MAG: two-component system response regulator FlrC, partial [Bradymonadia bacterium]